MTYSITARKAGETKTYTRVGDERMTALSNDLARLGWRVVVTLSAPMAA